MDPKPRQILLDKGNNLFTIVEPHQTLQDGMDRLSQLVEAQGKMALCVGDVHCVIFQEVSVRLHLRPKTPETKDHGCKWDIRYE